MRCHFCGESRDSLKRVWLCENCYAELFEDPPVTTKSDLLLARTVTGCAKALADIMLMSTRAIVSKGQDKGAISRQLDDVAAIADLDNILNNIDYKKPRRRRKSHAA